MQNLKSILKELEMQGDEQTISHCINVANLMEDFATELGESPTEWYYGGLLHDIGKVLVSSDVLKNSTVRLSDKQYAIVQNHVTSGYGIIKNLRLHKKNADAAIACSKYHHAWYNGRLNTAEHRGGYYYQSKYDAEYSLKGEAIPLIARACALCDVYEAITAERSYSPKQTKEEALEIMKRGREEGQFDRKLFRIFFEKVLDFSREQIAAN